MVKKFLVEKKKVSFSEKEIRLLNRFAILFFLSGIVYAFINRSDSFWSYAFPTMGVMITGAWGAFEAKQFGENKRKIEANPFYDIQREIFTEEELKDIFKNAITNNENLKGE